MRMTFPQARAGNLDEARLVLVIENVAAADISHRCAQTSCKLVENAAERALVRHLAFNPFRNQFQAVADFGLEVAVRRAARHGTDGAHAAIRLIGPPLVEVDLARAFLCPGQKRADHDRGRTGCNRLG